MKAGIMCIAFLLGSLGIAAGAEAENVLSPAHLAQADIPPFNSARASQLSAEKRRQYDAVFFNEIAIWNMSSNRYGPDVMASSAARKADFKRMAEDGYLPAYVALRLLNIVRGVELEDKEALDMLVKAAEEGDVSAMCAFVWMPVNRKLLPYEKSKVLGRQMEARGLAMGHQACMASRGIKYLFGRVPEIPQDTKKAMPLLLESARQGSYVAARSLFDIRNLKALSNQFDFTNQPEFERALCWGRLAEQYTNHAFFDNFLGLLRTYARANDRQDLVEMSYPYDPRRVPILHTVVKPEDCINLEKEAKGAGLPFDGSRQLARQTSSSHRSGPDKRLDL